MPLFSGSGDRPHRGALWLRLSLALAIYLVVEAALRRQGFTTLSGDDFFKYAIARRWSESPSVLVPPGSVQIPWLPLFFWMTGPLFWVSNSPWDTTVLMNNVLTAVALGALAIAAAILGRNRDDGLWAAVLAGLLSWTLWSANSFTEYAFFLCALSVAVAFLVAWLRAPRQAWLWAASVALVVTTLLRYEGWIVAAAIGVVLVTGIRGVSAREKVKRVGAAVIANVVPLGTAAFSVLQGAVPLPFYADYLREVSLGAELSADVSWYLAVIQIPALLFLVAPFVVPLLPTLLYRARGSGDQAARTYATVVGLSLAGLIFMSVWGFVPRAAPQRYVLWLVFLGAPLFPVLLHTSKRRWPIVMCLCLSASAGVAFGFLNNRTEHRGMRETARLVSDMQNVRTVASEALLRASLDQPAAGQDLYYQLLSQHAVLSCFLAPSQRLPISIIPSAEFAQISSRISPNRRDDAARDALRIEEPDAVVIWSSELLPRLEGRYKLVANSYNYKILVKRELRPDRSAWPTVHPRLHPAVETSLVKAAGYDHSDYMPYVLFELRRQPAKQVSIVMEGARQQHRIPVPGPLELGSVYTQEIPTIRDADVGFYQFFLVHGDGRDDLGKRFYYSTRRAALGRLLTSGGDPLSWLRILLSLL